jgi:pimeloyl-ACP methyl ester carboxylesterase
MHVRGRFCFSLSRMAWVVAWLFVSGSGFSALAQAPPNPAKKGPFQPPAKVTPPATKGPGAAPTAKMKGAKTAEPEEVSLETKDGLTLKATFYPGSEKDKKIKETVPIIMLHGLEGQRGDYHALALYLQSLGHASLVPDLRGHGQSKVQKRGDGATVTLEAEKMNRTGLEDMWRDVEACKKFLWERNNAGEVNIEQLCIIGAEFGSILAVRFAAYDWSLPDLPAYKQGKDVKALVLLSPPTSVKGVTLREAFNVPAVQSMISIMFIAGSKDSKSSAEAKKLYNSLQSHHPKLPDEEAQKLKSQELFLIQPETSLSGTKLLGSATGVSQKIAKFIELRLVDRKADFPWQERKNPLGN